MTSLHELARRALTAARHAHYSFLDVLIASTIAGAGCYLVAITIR